MFDYDKFMGRMNVPDEGIRQAIDRNNERLELEKKANEATLESVKILEDIAENTAYLKKIIEINRETQLNTEELTYVMRAIYGVSKAENKSEADNLYKNALNIINDSGEKVGNIANLVTLLSGIYNIVSTMV